MKISRAGIILIIVIVGFGLSGCGYYTKVMMRRDLVDGAEAYKKRKLVIAENLFRDAIKRDPNGSTAEGKTAQTFLARTLHSQFIANKQETAKADEAIKEYSRVLQEDITDQSSYKAVANLYENLGQQDKWLEWVTGRANNEKVPPEQRADALTSLAAKKYSCANEISDAEPVKKTVTEDGKQVFKFTKPEDPAMFEKLKQCSDEGLTLISKATQLAPNSDSAWSYQANLFAQKMRVAEMEGNKEEQEQFKTQAQESKEKFEVLNNARKAKEKAEDDRKKAEEEAAKKKK